MNHPPTLNSIGPTSKVHLYEAHQLPADITQIPQISVLYHYCAVMPQLYAQYLEEDEEVRCNELKMIVVQEENICTGETIAV